MHGSHDPLLVVLSIAIAILASYTALDLAGRVAVTAGRQRHAWIGGGALAMGFGIWSMHFTGMLAYNLPVPIRYHWGLTALSLGIAIGVSVVALRITGRERVAPAALLGAGLGMGVAIAGMHYTGMAAVRVPGALRYHAPLVAASVAIALVAATAALWLLLHFRFRTGARAAWGKAASAGVMGVAITGMHYTAMAAVTFVPAPGAADLGAGDLLGHSELAVGVVVGTLIVLALARLATMMNRGALPLPVMAASGMLAGLLFAVLGWAVWGMYNSFQQLTAEAFVMQHRIDRVDYLDEALTMSTQMAAASGNLVWETRYRQLDDELSAHLPEIVRWAEAAAQDAVAVRLRAAADTLLALEDQTFALVRQERRQEALALLASPRYTLQKQSYLEALAALKRTVHERITAQNDQFNRRVVLVGLLAALILVTLVLVGLFLRRAILAYAAQRNRDEAKLEEQKAHFRSLIENTSDIITILDADGKIVYESPAIQRVLGYEPEELVGRGSFELVHPDDLAVAREALDRMLREPGVVQIIVYRFRHKDGSWRVLETTGSNRLEDPAVRGIIRVSRDATERKRAEEALREGERRNRVMLDAIPDLIFRFTRTGEFLDFKAPDESDLYALPEQVVGRNLRELLPPDVAEPILVHTERALRSGAVERLEYALPMATGMREFEARLAPTGPDEALAVVRDVTEQKQAEHALRERARFDALGASVGQAVIGTGNLREILQQCAHALWNYTDAALVCIWTLDDSEQMLELQASAGMYTHLDGPHDRVPVGQSKIGSIVRDRKPHLTNDVPNDPGMDDLVWARHEGLRSFAGSPLIAGEQLVGVIALYARHPLSGEATLDALGTVSDRIAIAIQRARAEQELQRREEHFRSLTENASDLSTLLDAEGVIHYESPAVKHMLGYEPWELVGRVAFELVHPDDRPRVLEAFGQSLHSPGQEISAEYRFRHKDGSWRVLESRGNNQLTNPAVGRIVVNSRDVTERKQTEQEILRAKNEAEEANRAKSEFLSGMSHELRTPLNSVIGFANVLRKNKGGNLRERDLNYAERILSNGKHLLGLINDILDLSKIEAGKMRVERTPVALDALVQETLSELQGAVHGKDVELRAVVPDGVMPLEADRSKLKQVLINLVGNAIKFTERGSVTASVMLDPETGRPARIDVRDTGIGIPPERLSAIFRAFEQAESGTARRFGGTGLGLAISTSLCELMGYRLEVRSSVGVGSVFSVALRADADALTSVAAATPAWGDPGSFAGG